MTESSSQRRGGWPGLNLPAGPDDEFEALARAWREFQDVATGAKPPADVVAAATAHLRAATEMLTAHQVREREQIIGHRGSPGRAQAMSPQLFLTRWTDLEAEGTVRFGRFYLGGNGAVHGGAIPLLFDEILGRLANVGDRIPSRTAFLNVDYRAITPIDITLTVRARFDSESGRKRFLSAEIWNGDVLTAEARGLFVALNPGQP